MLKVDCVETVYFSYFSFLKALGVLPEELVGFVRLVFWVKLEGICICFGIVSFFVSVTEMMDVLASETFYSKLSIEKLTGSENLGVFLVSVCWLAFGVCGWLAILPWLAFCVCKRKSVLLRWSPRSWLPASSFDDLLLKCDSLIWFEYFLSDGFWAVPWPVFI